jgi:hypothetical protein
MYGSDTTTKLFFSMDLKLVNSMMDTMNLHGLIFMWDAGFILTVIMTLHTRSKLPEGSKFFSKEAFTWFIKVVNVISHPMLHISQCHKVAVAHL